MPQLDRWVCRRAVSALARMRAAGVRFGEGLAIQRVAPLAAVLGPPGGVSQTAA
jgi:hypothetical protein